MPLGLELARIRLPWSFTGWQTAAAALRPNRTTTGHACFHLAALGTGADVDALRDDLQRWAELLGWFRVVLPPRAPNDSAASRLRSALSLPANLSDLAWERIASKIWRHDRPLLLVDADESGATSVGDAVRALAAELDTRRGEGRMQQIALLSRHSEPGALVIRLDEGMPASAPDQILTNPEGEAWKAYLHHRIAWEVAGDPADARAVDPAIMRIRNGQEVGLDGVFREAARTRMTRLGRPMSEVRDLMFHWLADPRNVADSALLSAITWRPFGGVRLVRPWVARILLATFPDMPAWMRAAFRHAIVSQPLVASLLSATFVIEQHQRAQCMADANWRVLPQDLVEARRIAGRFGHNDVDSRLYPAGAVWCPDPVIDIESWLSYGDVRRLSGNAFSDEVAYLRNALAHGHPPTWPAVLILRQAMPDTGERSTWTT
jgi:hypothetical protein